MRIFGRGDESDAEMKWTRRRQRQLEDGEADMAALLRDLKNPVGSRVGQRLGAGLRRRATEHLLRQLDGVLQACEIDREHLPETAAVEDQGQLSFVQRGDTIGIRLALESGRLVDRQTILAHDQQLWNGGGAGALAILLHGTGGGPPVVAVGPAVSGEDLEWTLPVAALTDRRYRACLECFDAPEERRYAYGLAAGASLAGGEAVPPDQGQEEEGPVAVFSRQEGGAAGLVVGIECRTGAVDGLDFVAFERRLFDLLEGRVRFEPLSRFPASGRIYLALDPALQERVEEAVRQLNREWADRS